MVYVAKMSWQTMKLLLLGLFTLLEPLVCTVLAFALVLGMLASIVFEFSAVGPRFPFSEMLFMSLSFGVALVAYYSVLSVLSR